MSNLQKDMMRSHLPPLGPHQPRNSGARVGRQKDYNPTMWNEHYDEMEDVVLDNDDTFRVYFSKRDKTHQKPLLVLLHGGGYSALTWAHFTTEITAILNCQCLAIDLRGHGDTHVANESDLSGDTLANDVAQIMSKLYPETAPPIILVGHSMGGAICVHIASQELIPSLIGCVVIDVVEGSALEALSSMQSFLRSRPHFFKSIPQAIEWSVRSGQIRNVDSAKVSMPGQIMNIKTGKVATNELPLNDDDQMDKNESEIPQPPVPVYNHATISEDAEELDSTSNMQPPPPIPQSNTNEKKYTWRIDLSKTESFWPGWFNGLSEKFLGLSQPKLLLLASIDGLDRPLTVGQMQGKFQMQVLARCGHAVHEDRPHEVADVIAGYMIRNKFAEAFGEFVRQMPSC